MTTSTLQSIAEHRHANLFSQPVSAAIAPGYAQTVRRPMDLQAIRKRLESGAIRTTAEFERDVQLMFANACMYNAVDDHVHKVRACTTWNAAADCAGHVPRRDAHHARRARQGGRRESRRLRRQTVRAHATATICRREGRSPAGVSPPVRATAVKEANARTLKKRAVEEKSEEPSGRRRSTRGHR